MEKVIDVLVRLNAESNQQDWNKVNQYISKETNLVKELENRIESLNKERQKSGLAVQDYKRINTELAKSKKALDNLNNSYVEQTGIIEKLTAKQKRLQEQITKANNVKDIRAYNKELTETNKQLNSLTSQGGGIKSAIGGISTALAGGLTAIYAITKGVEFLNASFEEFKESEKTTNRLKLSLSNFGKEKYFNQLISDADTLAKKIGYLDNDDIVNAQNKLVTYGKLSVTQIRQLTPVIVDFAAKQQISIDDATEKIILGLEGQGRAFRQIGVSFKDGMTVGQNYQTVMSDVFNKVKGSAEDFGNTMAGMEAKSEQALKDLEEETGRRLAPMKRSWLEFKLTVISSISETVDYLSNSKFSEKIGFLFGLLSPGGNTKRNLDFLLKKQQEEIKAEINHQKVLAAIKRNGTDNGSDSAINPNADLDIKDAKSAENKKDLIDKIRSAEESTAQRVIDLNNQVRINKVKNEEQNIEAIKRRIELERQAELQKLELERTGNIKSGINSPVLSKNYGILRAGINTKYDDQLLQETKLFNDKKVQEEEKYNEQIINAEIDLLKRKAELQNHAIQIDFELIKKSAEKEIEESNKKYDELIKEAVKYGKDYTELIQAREDSAKAIQQKANEQITSEQEKFAKEQMEKIFRLYGIGVTKQKNGTEASLGDIVGLSKEDINNILDGVNATENLIETTLNGISQVLQAEIDKEQRIIEAQKERVDKAKQLAEEGNSAILTAEEDRLAKQEAAQRKRLQSQRAINAALVASQSAVNAAEAVGAVLNAAAEGDPYTIALRVVAAVAAIVGGVAATTAAVKSAQVTDTGFYEGGYTGDGNPRERAGHVHKGEYVMTAKETKELGKENLEYIAKAGLKPIKLPDGSMMLHKTGSIDVAGIKEGITQHRTDTINFDTKRIEQKLDKLYEGLGTLGTEFVLDETGFALKSARIKEFENKYRRL